MPTSWKIFSNYPDIWESMLADIRAAKESIYFEQYIFTDFEEGSVGRKFWDAFKERAQSGVKVRLILDAQGSFSLPIRGIGDSAKGNGIETIYFTLSTHRWRTFLKMFSREHRKLLVIDKKIAYVGGAIQQDKALKWGEIDTRFEGSLVLHLARAFEVVWEGLKKSNTFMTLPLLEDGDQFAVIGSGPLSNEHYILDSILEKIRGAKKIIKITSPYFVPPKKLLKELLNAVKRKVTVEIILPESIDNVFSKYCSLDYYDLLLRSGIKIYLFNKYFHGKSVQVDGQWCTFGSTNIDNMALLHNYELNVESKNPEFLLDFLKIFEFYKSGCHSLTLLEWRSRSFITKILEKIFIIFRPIA